MATEVGRTHKEHTGERSLMHAWGSTDREQTEGDSQWSSRLKSPLNGPSATLTAAGACGSTKRKGPGRRTNRCP